MRVFFFCWCTKSLTKDIAVVPLIEIFMFADLNNERRENEATRLLSILVSEEPITTAIEDDEKQIGAGEVVEILIEASEVKIGKNSFAPAKIKLEKVSVLRKIYLGMLKILDKADYREVPFRQKICGLALIITFRIIASK